MNPKDEPAFPSGEHFSVTDPYGNVNNHSKGPFYSGMTLRDYFAAKALVILDRHQSFSETASAAYQVADAMLEARKRQETK